MRISDLKLEISEGLRPAMIEFGMMRQGRIIASLARSNRVEDVEKSLEAARRLVSQVKLAKARAGMDWEKRRLTEANRFRVGEYVARLGIRRPAE